MVVLSLFAMNNLAAQTYRYHSHHHRPTVYLMAVEESDSLYSYPVSGVISVNRLIADNTRDDFTETMRTGFQQVPNPQFVFATRNNRFALGIGGEIMLRTSYDLKGAVDNIDFIPYDIPMWEIAVSLILLYITFAVTVWGAAKIYRVGILMHGKKPTFKELYKWLKY